MANHGESWKERCPVWPDVVARCGPVWSIWPSMAQCGGAQSPAVNRLNNKIVVWVVRRKADADWTGLDGVGRVGGLAGWRVVGSGVQSSPG
ncbi:hypothetical protein BDDG_11812 [Blastomyces dermatitidis ATCC 18188]|uniref:Uncharacterized protein n=1 Tax=Ajellomyces dermatitidis (strain ATCC 18188 / CBS 674.68) TaxID=653446 RepID=A0A0J9ELG8_AJEDA|nr:hypothetical protein BDDG_11812 [Blastomyces dermatitidis ATCC 18188]